MTRRGLRGYMPSDPDDQADWKPLRGRGEARTGSEGDSNESGSRDTDRQNGSDDSSGESRR